MKKDIPRMNLVKTTLIGLGSAGLNNTYYHAPDKLVMICEQLLKAMPPNIGLRIQIRSLNYLKDDGAKVRLNNFVKKLEGIENEEVGSEVAEVNDSNKEDKKEADCLDGGCSA